MNAFESLVATILEREGFWVRTSFKVVLTKQDKRDIDRDSSPRWELDVVGYRPGDNLLRVVECKSYLDSRGVTLAAFKPGHRHATRYKLFTNKTIRDVVLKRLVDQLTATKAIRESPTVQLCLAAGRVVASNAAELQAHFEANGWKLFGPDWLREHLTLIAADGYDNSVASMTAKLLK